MNVSKRTMKNMFDQTPLWSGWREGRVWRVPIYPKIDLAEMLSAADEPASPEDLPVVEFWAEPVIKNLNKTKVWVFYGRYGETKALVHVMDRN